MRDLYRSKAIALAFGPILLTGCMTTDPGAGRADQPGAGPTASAPASQRAPGSTANMNHSSMSNMTGMNHSSMSNMKGMDHSSMSADKHGATHDGHGAGDGHGASMAGKPGVAAQAKRTINVAALDTMRFEPPEVRVQAGETVQFVVTNRGKIPHEFVIGTAKEQKDHAAMMQKMPDMKHEEANAMTLAPGETKTLVWQFADADAIEIACHVPGHYPAGMFSKVEVSPRKQ